MSTETHNGTVLNTYEDYFYNAPDETFSIISAAVRSGHQSAICLVEMMGILRPLNFYFLSLPQVLSLSLTLL